MEKIKIGIVIADNDEYLPLEKLMPALGGKPTVIAGRNGHIFTVNAENGQAEVTAVCSGIGKVNAAVAATALAEKGVDLILNCGLSGGISGIARHELMIAETFTEHDFDLTGLGYKPCQKPGQEYIYRSSEDINAVFKAIMPEAKIGMAVSGDCFVSDSGKRDFLKNEFGAMACDMETAAVAYVCSAYNIKFGCVRKISDDAGASAADSYREVNVLAEDALIKVLLQAVSRIAESL